MADERQGMVPDRFLVEMAQSSPQEVEVGGRMVRPGSRVRLKPRPGCDDLVDALLAGCIAVIDGIDEDEAGKTHVAVVLEDDPGRDLGGARHPSHRFFFAPSELEPLEEYEGERPRRVLVAGIGNIFLGDDGFGVAVARYLAARTLPAGIDVADFGIRGMDLAYALGHGYDAAILVDTVSRGEPPGTLQILEPDEERPVATLDAHRMDPLAVVGLARRLGQLPAHLFIVGCEPEEISEEWHPERTMRLSDPVAAAVHKAAEIVIEMATTLVGYDVDAVRTTTHEGVMP